MPRVFLSHSSRDGRQAAAVKQWLIEHEPGLADEIFLDFDPDTGITVGQRWKDALEKANARCEAVICLLSPHWTASAECDTEYRYAETLHKAIIVARLEPVPDTNITSEWQRCDLFAGEAPTTAIAVDAGDPVVLSTQGLQRLRNGLRALGIGAENFPWPPRGDPDRAPYRGWAPMDEADAAVFFGRDAEIMRGLEKLRGMRVAGVESVLAILGPSGSGKSSFLRAGLLPRLRRDDRRFLPMDIVRPRRAVLSGDTGLASAVYRLRVGMGLREPMLGAVKNACEAGRVGQLLAWIEEIRAAARTMLIDLPADQPSPTLVLPLDQAEELFNADAGPEAPLFLELLAGILQSKTSVTPTLLVALTIRADRYEPLQTATQLLAVKSIGFDDLKPMPRPGYSEVITGPARRATEAGHRLTVQPALVERLLDDTADSADALPLLALTLERLYRDFGADGDLTLEEYELAGGLARVVQNEIDQLLSGDPVQRKAELNVLHDAFIPWLSRISPDNDQPMRRLARFDDLPVPSRPLIDKFVERRLLVKDDRGGQVVVEVALESLLRQWDELAGWLRSESADLRRLDSLERAAAEWRANGRKEDWLLRGARLEEGAGLADRPGFGDRLTSLRDYLDASSALENARIAAEKRRQEAELRAAREKQEAAEARAAAELRAKQEAQRHAAVLQQRIREVTALRLVAEAKTILTGSGSGTEVRALQLLLAANSLEPAQTEGGLLDAAIALRSLARIIETSAFQGTLAVSSDGSRIVTGNQDGPVRLWDAATGEQIGQPMLGHTDEVWATAFDRLAQRVVSGGRDGKLRLWNASTGEQIGEPMTAGEDPVLCAAFSPDGRYVVSGGCDHRVRLWDVTTGKPAGLMSGHRGDVYGVAFSPDGRLIASGSVDRTARIWDAATRAPVGHPLDDHGDTVQGVAFSPDGRRIATGSWDGTVRMWDVASAQQVGVPLNMSITSPESVWSVAFGPRGRHIAAGGRDGNVRVWDAETAAPLCEPMRGSPGVGTVGFLPHSHQLISGHFDGTVRTWDTTKGQPFSGPAAVLRVTFSPDGQRILAGGRDGTIRIWDATEGRQVGDPLTGHAGGVFSVAVHPDGKQIVSSGEDATIRIWDFGSGQQCGSLTAGTDASVLAVAYRPDGDCVVSGDRDGTIRLWNIATRRQDCEPLTGHRGEVYGVAFSPDGQRVVSCGADGTVRIWDTNTGREAGLTIRGHTDDVFGVAFSPDGRRIVSGGYDGTVRIWDAATGAPLTLTEPARHSDQVYAVAFAPDGRHIVSAGRDQCLRVWDATTGKQVGQLIAGHTAEVYTVALSRDGTRMASGDADGTVRVWPGPASWRNELCAKLTRNLSHAQWNEWISPEIDYTVICPGLSVPD